ncbi:MAG: TM2 domain-containing protein [Corynebacterium sp.]|uniref:TM2 domain-containing protein n=1 Tax=Corynebacterium sp. TaxID=1720 RepID=UPI0026DB04C6|nr:TM2 domain-containing protein [Corynebacterium sp.]MDO5097460.1 TM2 domain-containing protein [Corynebacterium sp.]
MTNPNNTPDPMANPFPNPASAHNDYYGTGQPYNADGYAAYTPQPTTYQTPTTYGSTPGMYDSTYGTVPLEQTYTQPGLMPQYGFVPGTMQPTKDKTIAILLWVFLSGASAHNFYTGFYSIAITQICLGFFGALLTATVLLSFIGLPMLLAVFVWVWVDLIQMITDSGRFRYSFKR